MFFLLFIITIFISGYFFDLSYDGQGYQQEAIVQLANGWNPVYGKPVEGIHGLWITHYAKGPWFAATSLYKLVGHIESAKAFNLFYIYASFLISLVALLTVFKEKPERSVLFAALFALNPVAVNQSFSFYCDGQLASLLTIMVALSFLIIKKPSRLNFLLYALAIILALNIKFTAVVYVTVLVFGLITGLLLYNKKEIAAKIYIIATISYLIGIVLVGFNPYITNTTQQGHPFYPLAGKNSVNIIDSNMPADFAGKSSMAKLVKSVFAESSNLYTPAKSVLKFPLIIHLDEVKVFGLTDVRIAGFGPLFGTITLLSIVALLALLALNFSKRKSVKETLVALGFIIVVMISGVVNPEVWWARYAPQLWMLPLLVAIAVIYLEETEWMRKLSKAMVALIALNLIITSSAYALHQVEANRTLKGQLRTLANSRKPVIVDFNSFTSNRVRFKEVGIKFKEVESLPGTATIRLFESETSAIIPK
jgi:hypothetical protein